MSKKHNLSIPNEHWVTFIDLLYSAILHTDPESMPEESADFVQQIIRDAFLEGDILVVDNKIVAKFDKETN